MDEKNKSIHLYLRILSYSVIAFTLAFLLNNLLTVWAEWPGVRKIFSHYELFGHKQKSLQGSDLNLGYMQIGLYLICIGLLISYVFKTYSQTLEKDSEILSKFSAYIVRLSLIHI